MQFSKRGGNAETIGATPLRKLLFRPIPNRSADTVIIMGFRYCFSLYNRNTLLNGLVLCGQSYNQARSVTTTPTRNRAHSTTMMPQKCPRNNARNSCGALYLTHTGFEKIGTKVLDGEQCRRSGVHRNILYRGAQTDIPEINIPLGLDRVYVNTQSKWPVQFGTKRHMHIG